MTAALLVPLLPLLTVLLVLVGREASRRERVKIGTWPLGAAFFGAIWTLYVVATSGPISVRLYDPADANILPLPISFYIDRLSPLMVLVVPAIGTLLYTGSLDYMYQAPHVRRYFSTIGVAICVLFRM